MMPRRPAMADKNIAGDYLEVLETMKCFCPRLSF